jgi:hypothetical protein
MKGREKSFEELVALVAAIDPDLVAAVDDVDYSLIDMVLDRSLAERVDFSAKAADTLKGLQRADR